MRRSVGEATLAVYVGRPMDGVARARSRKAPDVRTRRGRGRKRATAAWRRARTIALILGLAVAVVAPSTLAASRDSAPRAQVIVMAEPGATASIESAVEHVGGVVERRLSIIGGFSAAVPTDVLLTLRGLPGVVSVSADSEMQPQDATYDPATDVDSMNAVTRYTGAVDWWNTGCTGAGVDVAVIDTGVSPVEGLATPGKVSTGRTSRSSRRRPTSGAPTRSATGRSWPDSSPGTIPSSPFLRGRSALGLSGHRPDARIVSVKVGTADGGTDVFQVIAAIDWVVQHAQDPGLNIRVLNLSYGTNSTQLYTMDPLAFAAEQAWKHGIVVVASGGNSGFQRHMNNAPALSNPAFDPLLLAVGASDSQGTDTLADDLVPAFSPWPKRGATRSRPRRTRHPSAGAARAELVHRREPPRRAPRRPVLPGAGRRKQRRSCRGRQRSFSRSTCPRPRSGQAVDHHHRVSDQREVSGDRRR